MELGRSWRCWAVIPSLVITFAVTIGVMSNSVASASSLFTPSAGTASEMSSCAEFSQAEQSINPLLARNSYLKAASQAAAAESSNPGWIKIAKVIASDAALPYAMLTPTQEETSRADIATITSACGQLGDLRMAVSSAPPAADPLNPNDQAVWNYLKANTPLNSVQVAGLVGNFMEESAGSMSGNESECGNNPIAPPAESCGVGIAQWTWTGKNTGRWGPLVTLAKADGETYAGYGTTNSAYFPSTSVDEQYVVEELNNSYKSVLVDLEGCNSTACSTQIVQQYYEVPQDYKNFTCDSTNVSHYCERLANANEALAAYGNYQPTNNSFLGFQANTGEFDTYSSTSGQFNTHLGMMSGTSPSIVALPSGGYEAAFQANTGALVVWGAAGSQILGLGMLAGTSPSIAAASSGGYEVGFQANTGELDTFSSTTGQFNVHLGMMVGTSPSIVP